MHYCYLFALLVWALAAGPVEAGRYDEPAFLTNHLRSGGPPKDGIPALTNPTFVSPNEVGYVRDDETVMGLVINGERIGNRLRLMPVVETTWAMWKQMYPNTTVIQTGTGWERYLSDRPPYNMV